MAAVASERVVVLMTPTEKRRLEAKARRLGASTGELVRRSVKAYEPEINDAELEKLLDQLIEAQRAAIAALDQADRELAETRAYFAEKRRKEG